MSKAIPFVIPTTTHVNVTQSVAYNFFLRRVNKDGPIPEHLPNMSKCWLWISPPVRDGYGKINLNGISLRAHRASWMLHHGNIANGLFVLHKCDNKMCVNPSHLFLGTHDDNMKDMVKKGRSASGDKNNFRKHPEQYWGEKNPSAKVTAVDVITIRHLYSTGNFTHKKIGAMFNITDEASRHICNRTAWSHIS